MIFWLKILQNTYILQMLNHKNIRNKKKVKFHEVCHSIKRHLLFWCFKKLLQNATETLFLKYAESNLKLNKNLEFLKSNCTYRLNASRHRFFYNDWKKNCRILATISLLMATLRNHGFSNELQEGKPIDKRRSRKSYQQKITKKRSLLAQIKCTYLYSNI